MMQGYQSIVITLPYWIMVDKNDPPRLDEAEEISIGGNLVRIYSPFLSAPDDFFPMPRVNFSKLPFLPGCRPDDPYHFDRVPGVPVIVPGLGRPTDSLRFDVLDPGYFEPIMAHLVKLLRWSSGQWWIDRSLDVFRQLGPVSFPVSPSGKPTKFGNSVDGQAAGTTVLKWGEVPVSRALWKQAVQYLAAGCDIPIYEELFLDARYFLSKSDMRRVVLDLATACEQIAERTIERLWVDRNPNSGYKKSKAIKGNQTDLEQHLDKGLNSICGRSYKVEHPEQWELIAFLWDARGNIAHGRNPEYRRHQPVAVPVDKLVALKFVTAARHCIDWLCSLP